MTIIAPVTWGSVTARSDNVIIIGSGPSLSNFDFDLVAQAQQLGAYVIAVNGSVASVPFADAWFTLDPHNLADRIKPIKGNCWYAAIPDSFGTRFSPIESHKPTPPPMVTYLHRLVGNGHFAAKFGLSEDTSAIYTGNSAYGALGVAYHMRAKRVVLLGVDGSTGYYYSKDQNGDLSHLPQLFASALPQLQTRSMVVINGSPASAITCFERFHPQDAVQWMINGMKV
jgi:hypothetical protein